MLRLKGLAQASKYQQLETYLKNGQWQKADKETYLLKVAECRRSGDFLPGTALPPSQIIGFPNRFLRKLPLQIWRFRGFVGAGSP